MIAPAFLLYAKLHRAGAGPARLMAAFGRIDARIAALDVALDTHPLCRDGAWQALLPPAAAPDRLGPVLAELARPHASDLPVARPNPLPSVDRPAPPRGVQQVQSSPAASGQLKSRMVDTSVPGHSHSPKKPGAAPLRSLAQTKFSAATAFAPRPPATTDGLYQHPPGLAGSADPVLASAAARRVPPAPPVARQRLVEDVLNGDGTGRTAGLSAAEPMLGPSLQQISRLLDRIALGSVRSGGASVDRGTAVGFFAPPGKATDAAPMPSGAPRQTQPFAAQPGTGLARLLARGGADRGGGDGLTPAGPGFGAEVLLAPDHAAPNMPQTVAARGPDLTRSDRLPLRPGAGPDAAITPAGSEALARALTDLLRREARAAGIDLRGDR